MLQLIACILMLVPLIALPVVVFLASRPLGIAVAVLSLILAIPVAVAAYAHLDLLRVKRRYGLSDDEVVEFSRLVPSLARRPEFDGLRERDTKRSVKEVAAEIIRQRRKLPADVRSTAGPAADAAAPARRRRPPQHQR